MSAAACNALSARGPSCARSAPPVRPGARKAPRAPAAAPRCCSSEHECRTEPLGARQAPSAAPVVAALAALALLAPGAPALADEATLRAPAPTMDVAEAAQGDAMPTANGPAPGGKPYTPGQFEPVAPPSWQIWFGAAIGVFPFIIASYEFGKRILIQRRCQRCEGSGLVPSSRVKERLVKCPECGGFFPWQSWSRFFEANAPGQVGNGGPLLQPRGQTSVFYKVPPKPEEGAKREVSAGAGGDKSESS